MPIVDIVVPAEIGGEEGVVVTWFKRQGDTIEKGEVLVIVQAAKASFEIPAPLSGRVVAILAQQGEVVKLGQVLAQIEDAALEPGVTPPSISPAKTSHGVLSSPAAKRLAREHNIDLSQVSTVGGEKRITEKDVLAFIEAQKTVDEVMVGKVKISPLANKIAEEQGVDIAFIQGSGPMGRIMKEDVLRAAEDKGKKLSPAPAGLKQVKETIPIRGVRQVIFDRMHQSLQQSAQLTLNMEVNMGELGRLRTTLVDRLKDQGIRISYNAILVKIIARALEVHPKMNSSVMKDEVWLWESVNVGVAVDAEQGLIVPVVRDANKKDLIAIQKVIDDKVERAKSKKLVPDDLQGGTFTLTGLGFLDIEAFTPILNPPEAGILGVGKIIEKPVVENGQITVGQRMMLSLTFDHRIIDGADGARFLKTLKSYIETPYLLLA